MSENIFLAALVKGVIKYMAQINILNLTFGYEQSMENVFENISIILDTDWKLGLIGRNGKGKTTLLQLLMGNLKAQGVIVSPMEFDYFPYTIGDDEIKLCAVDLLEKWKNDCELWRVCVELEKLQISQDKLFQPISTLSHGEITKIMLAVLFSGDNDFLLIDEPTNHLDNQARNVVKDYLKSKKGFIVVSHDRELLDACINHVLILNRKTIEVQSGNFSSWWENKSRKDNFARTENEKHLKEIAKLKHAAQQSALWAQKNESTKIGFNPIEEHDRSKNTRAYIGAKTKKMQSRVKQYKQRMDREIEQKEGLLQDVENPRQLKLNPLVYWKENLIDCKEYSLVYNVSAEQVINNLTFRINRGERVILHGENGCGKSSMVKSILAHAAGDDITTVIKENGNLNVASGLVISYVNQDTSFLKGNLKEFCRSRNLEISLFYAILHNLDFETSQFMKPMENFSEGQKKKVLIAASLMIPAHLYIWDEPLNYLDVFSRMQIEALILKIKPTMLIIEHDSYFREKIATKIIDMHK